MTDDGPADPFTAPPFNYAQLLLEGRMQHEHLIRQTRHTEAETTVTAMSEDDLRALAFYIAAKAIADDCRTLSHLKHWQRWWRGVDGLDEDGKPADIEGTPLQLWKVMEPHPDDDGFGTIHHPPADS